MSHKKSNVTLRVILALVILVLGGISAWGTWLSYHYKGPIKEKLPTWVSDATDGEYHVSLKDISINIITRRVTLVGVHFWPDSIKVNELKELRKESRITTFEFDIPKAEVTGVDWSSILTDKKISCGQLILWQTKGIITQIPIALDSVERKITDSLKKNKKPIDPTIKNFSIKQISLLESDITFKSKTKKDDSFSLSMKNCNVTLNDWSLTPGQKNDKSRFLFAKKGSVKLDSFIYKKEGSFYNISTASIHFETENNSLLIKDLSITPALSKDEFYKAIGHQKEIYHLHFPSLVFANFNWEKMISNNELFSDSLTLKDPNLSIYLSRIPPKNPESKLGKYPQQILQKLSIKTNIQTIQINGGHLVYQEVSDRTHKTGDIRFDDVHGSVSNVTNVDSIIAKNKNCTITLGAKLYGSSPINATFQLALDDTNGRFTMDGNVKDLNAAQINNTALALALTEISSLHLSRMDMHVEGNQYAGHGNVTMLYSNLKLALQKLDSSGSKRELNETPLLSLIANNIVLYSDNPMTGQEVRTATTELKRDPHKSFFNLIWKNIYQGIEKTVVKNKKIENLAKKTDKNGKKVSFLKRLFGKKNK